MSALEHMQSPGWDIVKDSEGFIEDGLPFGEGFLDVGPLDETEFEVIYRRGDRLRGRVDFSTQYHAEGLRWEITGPPIVTYSVHD